MTLQHVTDAELFRHVWARRLGDYGNEKRAKALQRLEARGKGRACAWQLSQAQDTIIRALHSHLITLHKPPSHVILAVGGYGRAMLAPQSDVDLLFLAQDPQDGAIKAIVTMMLYVLWDLKLKVGHALRSVPECLNLARKDMTIRTALLDARYISGDETLFTHFQSQFAAKILSRGAEEFVATKLAEREKRINRQGESRYLVEPNVKEGKGGLRDLNTLSWIMKYVFRVHNLEEWARLSLFPRMNWLFLNAVKIFCGPCAVTYIFSPDALKSD